MRGSLRKYCSIDIMAEVEARSGYETGDWATFEKSQKKFYFDLDPKTKGISGTIPPPINRKIEEERRHRTKSLFFAIHPNCESPHRRRGDNANTVRVLNTLEGCQTLCKKIPNEI